MRIVAQMIDIKTGVRSEAMDADVNEMATELDKSIPDEKRDQLAVLVIMDDTKGELDISTCPFLSLQAFIDYYAEAQANG